MTPQVTGRPPAQEKRLTPWIVHDLSRLAWIIEYRAAELTEEERQEVREAADRMLRAVR